MYIASIMSTAARDLTACVPAVCVPNRINKICQVQDQTTATVDRQKRGINKKWYPPPNTKITFCAPETDSESGLPRKRPVFLLLLGRRSTRKEGRREEERAADPVQRKERQRRDKIASPEARALTSLRAGFDTTSFSFINVQKVCVQYMRVDGVSRRERERDREPDRP